jgi:2-iminobutanoate/2-iminopropanoate deaminase
MEDKVKQSTNPETVHEPVGRYVHTIEVSGENRLLFVSGQVGMDRDGNVPEDPAAQFEVALRNVMLNVEAAGFEATDIVKLITYVVGDLDPAKRREAPGPSPRRARHDVDPALRQQAGRPAVPRRDRRLGGAVATSRHGPASHAAPRANVGPIAS